MSGMTTFHRLLTGSHAHSGGKVEAATGHARIPDGRVDYLSAMFKPKKTTCAQLEVTDVPGLISGGDFLGAVRDCDALANIVRGFGDGGAREGGGALNDALSIDAELLLADMQLVETRLSRIGGGSKRKAENPLEEKALERCLELLNDRVPLAPDALSEEYRDALSHVSFVSGKPRLIVVNLDEDSFRSGEWDGRDEIAAHCSERGFERMEVCASVEEEIGLLPEEDRGAFYEELGVAESGVGRIAKSLYRLLGLASFLTAGEDEVKAWTIRAGLSAKKAAGKIHTDIERGFIRAEVVAFDRLREAGSMAAARERGHFRLEGKEYPVRDGDIIHFRFNV